MKKIKDFFMYTLKKLRIVLLLIILNPVVLSKGYLILSGRLNYSNSNIALIYGGIISDNLLLYILCPLFLVLNSDLTNYLNRAFVRTRYVNIMTWWRDKATITLILAGLYVVFNNIVPMLLIFIIQKSIIEYISDILLLLILQFAGFAVIGLIYNISELLLNKVNICIVLNIILFGALKVIKSIFSIKNTFLYEYMTFNHKVSLKYIKIETVDYIYLLTSLFIFILVYIFGYLYSLRKDFYRSD